MFYLFFRFRFSWAETFINSQNKQKQSQAFIQWENFVQLYMIINTQSWSWRLKVSTAEKENASKSRDFQAFFTEDRRII